ncbi:MAG: hypothetical protein OMM_13858 [Candidatus Magnetoglobus multicellularis str. Araruama]|uniref:Uncharacterized protein n=1 Tax=Candidatus Magnetoglobus multicellularis str. Araruama TaxID=890399 RepID=A0A1V1NT04_9BACT|nr:MAG: hypothetical protein OMM_13858 [Candidatus Magnetoglobus multicellularis str. Araruama]
MRVHHIAKNIDAECYRESDSHYYIRFDDGRRSRWVKTKCHAFDDTEHWFEKEIVPLGQAPETDAIALTPIKSQGCDGVAIKGFYDAQNKRVYCRLNGFSGLQTIKRYTANKLFEKFLRKGLIVMNTTCL